MVRKANVMPIVALSGGFDPIHEGHIDLIKEASSYGNVVVILNSNAWLKRKKGYIFMRWEQRAAILKELRSIYDVIPVNDLDNTVCEALRRLKPDYFANGGDRTLDNTPELSLCEELGITPLFNIGGGKVASSSELIRAAHA